MNATLYLFTIRWSVSDGLPDTDQVHSSTEGGHPDRWQRGESLNSTGRLFDRPSSSIFNMSAPTQLQASRMTELGGTAELGDVDVLAWKPGGEIKIIECKRLQLARTVAEVAEICRRFRGEAKDELDKHVQRVKWILANLAGLQRIVGFVPDQANIDDRLVTNTHVPMMYLSSLPIRADKIGPLR